MFFLPVSTIFWFTRNLKFWFQTEDNVLAIVHNRIAINNLLRTKSFFDLLLNIFGWVFHKDGWIWVTFGHFFLSFNKPRDHTVGNNNRFFLFIFAVLNGQHVDFPLINSQLAEIDVQEENISTLHARIEKLRDFQLIWLFFSHNSCTFLNSSNRVRTSNIHHSHPVLIGSSINLLWGPDEFDILEFHACSFPDFNKVFPNSSDFFKITIILSIEHGEVVSNPENKDTSCIDHFVNISCSQKTLCNVHSSWRFKPIICPWEFFALEFFLDHFIGSNNFLSHRFDKFDSFLHGQTE